MSIFTHCGYNSLGWSESRKSMIRSIEKRRAKSFPRNAVRSIGVRAIFARGSGNPFAQKILASCPNFYETVERKLGPCNKIGRTGIWKWLDTVFQSQYLPSLSINFVATNKHLEKIATTVVLDKQGNLSWSGLQWHRSFGAVIATKWRHYLLYLQQYFSLGTVLTKSFRGALSSNSRLDVREVKTEP